MRKSVPLPLAPQGNSAQDRFNAGILKVLKDLRLDVVTQEDWKDVTYLNSWVDFSTVYHSVGYMKDNMGFVHTRGLCKNGTSGVCFTLPEGYRPSKDLLFTLYHFDYNTNPGRVSISSGGTFTFSNYSNSAVSLEGIIFQAEA
jgi:hypothetical protein